MIELFDGSLTVWVVHWHRSECWFNMNSRLWKIQSLYNEIKSLTILGSRTVIATYSPFIPEGWKSQKYSFSAILKPPKNLIIDSGITYWVNIMILLTDIKVTTTLWSYYEIDKLHTFQIYHMKGIVRYDSPRTDH